MLIDQVLPKYDRREYHTIEIRGNRSEVYRTVRTIDFSDSSIIRSLFRLRGLPTTSVRLDDLLQAGFLLVDELPDKELLLGLVGRFWTLRPEIMKLDAAQYRRYNAGGFAKLGWNFAVRDSAPGLIELSTETRILCTGTHCKRRFKLYWFLIGRFSGLTRREMLRTVKRRVEG